MNIFTKIAVIGTSVLALGGLVACQSTHTPTAGERPMMKDKAERGDMRGGHGRGEKHEGRGRGEHGERGGKERMTAEQRAAFDAQVKQACLGKEGQNVSITLNGQTIQGTCTMKLQPTPPATTATP
ncbi:MAG: hypothetical protein Q4D05_08280, partial [Acinetobacter sp.]|nr:hypothetical protein [Acinetobacter sp.]